MKLVFLPDHEDEWTIKGYNVGIWNDLDLTVPFYFELDVSGKTKFEKRGELEPNGIKSITYLEFKHISLEPEFEIKFWIKEESNKMNAFSTKTRIKAKQFFSKIALIPGTDLKGIIYTLEEKIKTKKTSGENLIDYTKNNINIRDTNAEERLVFNSNEFDLKSYLEFENEIDLHIENLASNHNKLTKQEKYQLQIKCAIDFLDKAIKVGIDRVFLIHGIGKGKLKDGIKELLHKHPNVKRYKNEYHHKYGYGATEVELR